MKSIEKRAAATFLGGLDEYTTTAASMSDDVIDLASSEDEDGLVGEHPRARANPAARHS